MKRNLYLKIQGKEEALAYFLNQFQSKAHQEEVISVADSLDRVTSEAVMAVISSPSYNSCAMDGIAVISSHTKNASEDNPLVLTECIDYVEADTGDSIQPPYDAVIMAEELIECEEGYKIIAPAHPFAHVRPVGEDIVAHEMVLPSMHRIRPIDVATLLSAGIREIAVLRQPRVAILPTGDEMIDYHEKPERGKIMETNSYLFENLIRKHGGIPVRHAIIEDNCELLKREIQKAVEHSDIVIINAGSSAGRDDYTIHALRELGEVYTHGVAIKPGKPVILAGISGKPVIGLPGYPVSAYLTFMEFVVPLLSLYTGQTQEIYPVVEAVLAKTLMSGLKYEEYVRVKLGLVDGQLIASPLNRGAGASMSLVQADGFCVIPQNSEGIQAHETVKVRCIRELNQIQNTIVSIGSHDLILDVISDLLRKKNSVSYLSSTHVGSMGGLIALRKKETHLAPTHLLDEKSGIYNEAVIKEMFGDEKMVLIKGVKRRQGFLVKKGNPKAIFCMEDLKRDVRYINRQNGAGTRVLFDYELKKAGMEPQEVEGYENEAATHMAAAVAVAEDNADVGMGIYSCAKAMNLDFVDIACEEYDFAAYKSTLELPIMKDFLQILKSEEMKEQLRQLGGYEFDEIGEIREIR